MSAHRSTISVQSCSSASWYSSQVDLCQVWGCHWSVSCSWCWNLKTSTLNCLPYTMSHILDKPGIKLKPAHAVSGRCQWVGVSSRAPWTQKLSAVPRTTPCQWYLQPTRSRHMPLKWSPILDTEWKEPQLTQSWRAHAWQSRWETSDLHIPPPDLAVSPTAPRGGSLSLSM